jgi:hypothetical protein
LKEFSPIRVNPAVVQFEGKRLVNAAEVVVHEVQRNCVPVVLQLLAESACQPRKTAHPHPHRKVLSFNKRS